MEYEAAEDRGPIRARDRGALPPMPRDMLFAHGFAIRLRRKVAEVGLVLVARRHGPGVRFFPAPAGKLPPFAGLLAPAGNDAGYGLAVSAHRFLRLMAPHVDWPGAAQFRRFRASMAAIPPSARERIWRMLAPVFGQGGQDTRLSRRRFLMALGFAAPALTPWMRSFGPGGTVLKGPFAGDAPPSSGPGKARAALFLHSAYYNFGYMAKALRARGWDAVSASTADPEGYPKLYTHGHDVVLYDADPALMRAKIARFVADTIERFGVIHFYGVGTASMFNENWDVNPRHDRMPWDLLEWKRRGALVGYSTTGCLDLVSQASFRAWSGNMCGICPWEGQGSVCSDAKNLAWGWKLSSLADLICLETDVRLDARVTPHAFHEPLTYALDPQIWRPDLEIPAEFVQERRSPDEVLVYHGVGNYEARLREGRNVKGTPAVLRAIETLQAEGVPIRLMFTREVPNLQNRFIQAQADIIIDQLNYGRYGAIAREGMMLGRPVVGAVKTGEPFGEPSRCIAECPIVDASEDTVVDVLRDLARDPARRSALGEASRAYAVKWWSADVLAERFERVYDTLQATGRVPTWEELQ